MAASFFQGTAHAAAYLKFRPTPPASLVQSVLKYLENEIPKNSNKKWASAIDVGCGSGQSTRLLADHFDSIVGLDVSDAQLKEASKNTSQSNISYRTSGAEKLDFPSTSQQLVTSCQACHWFDLPKFFAEADRILVPGGVIALFGYLFPRVVNHSKAELIVSFIDDIYVNKTAGCWGSDREHVDDAYRNKAFIPPYESVIREDSHCLVKEASVADLSGYISSWSGYREFCNKNGNEAGEQMLAQFVKDTMDALGESKDPASTMLQLKFPYFLIMARK